MYEPFPVFVLRTPRYPYLFLKGDPREKMQDPQVQEAIFLASPVLYKELQKMIGGEIRDEKEKERIYASFNRYLSRMSTRSTPYGLFAGCSLGELGDDTVITLNDTIGRTTRLDMYYLCALSQALLKIPEIKSEIRYYPNTSLYPVGKKYRYVEYQYVKDRRVHRISAVERSKYLTDLLKMAENGALIPEMVLYLAEQEIESEIAVGFIDELIESQILVGELDPFVTGDDFFSRIIEILQRLAGDNQLLSLIEEVQSLLSQLDMDTGHSMDLYKKIIDKIDTIKVPYEEKFLFQVDIVRDTCRATLGTEVMDEVRSAMVFLNKITQLRKNETLSRFQQDFQNRYEDKEVSIMEVLDPELGIGYPSGSNNGDIAPLLDHFYLPGKEEQRMFYTGIFQSVLQRKTIECLSRGNNEIVFDDNDFKDFKVNWDDLPPTLYTIFEMIRVNPNEILIQLKSFGGSCGANLLARFAHMDERICQLVRDITSTEQRLMPDIIFGEIAHLPESRVGNILVRPHIRDYEILYMANSDLPKDRIIHMSDLYLSVRQGRLFLRSKRLNKEIIPRLTNAHNYHNHSMPVYRFLCDMQVQNGRGGLYFNWGHLESELEYRPRVRYKNTILSPAGWTVKADDLKPFFSILYDNDLINRTTEWRQTISLPLHVLLADGDNELFVDWSCANSIRSFFSIIKKRQSLLFYEFIFSQENAVVKDNEGRAYLNECIIAFHKN